MKLKKLLRDLPVHIKGKDVEVSGLCSDSRKCKHGDVFIARRGQNYDGTRFIADALAAGAVAIITDILDPFCSATQVITALVGEMEIELAKRFFNNPASKLCMIGITGTNGKTTTSYLVRHLLKDCSLIGTIEAIIGEHHFPSLLTTPDIIALQKMLSMMVEEKSKSCVMEVSSHALEQRRVAGIEYDIAIYTNLSQDHLDYHKTMENYFNSKAKLFKGLTAKASALINADCPYAKRIETKAKVITFGIDTCADLRAFDIEMSASSIAFTVVHKRESARFVCPLIGRFNIYNCLSAIGVALIKGQSLEQIAKKLKTFTAVPGRLERIDNNRGFHIFVDFAHTADALENVCSELKRLCKGRLLTLFGCGGDRDADKRPKMGAAASKHSDYVLITSDNPRNEEPLDICRAIAAGCKVNYAIEPDRKKAIESLLAMAKPGDVLLIAGKGHERTQSFANKTYPFDDRQTVKTHLAQTPTIPV
ncbi:MAG: UDP-N-acetylmuramoyl-L-alanyl-D-glutamate--2,6-diaminopimelate ligase [Chlamydiales bacterium]|nr:UDP-N-acetylmuramoyl-L-alanyl-D-glutamate--2,6-diaminopimelate ligase [Chlamydiales bacterium]